MLTSVGSRAGNFNQNLRARHRAGVERWIKFFWTAGGVEIILSGTGAGQSKNIICG